MLAFLLDPLTAPFMQAALLEMGMLSLMSAVVGSYVVLRGLGFLTLALSHGIFPGVVIAYLLGWSYLLMSVVTGLVISLLVGLAGRNRRVGGDSAIAVIYTGAFALGIVLVSAARSFRGLADILFGRPFAITAEDLLLTAGVSTLALALVYAFRKELLLAAFDRSMALAMGVPVGRLELLFLVILAVCIIVALPAIGNIQLVALLITPAATARLLATRLPGLIAWSWLFALTGSVSGLYLAYHLDLRAGSSVVACLTFIFLLVLCISPRRGLFQRWLALKAQPGP